MLKKFFIFSPFFIFALNSFAAPLPIAPKTITPTIPTSLTAQPTTQPNAAAINAANAANAPKDLNAPNMALAQSLTQMQNNDVRWLTSNIGPFLALYTPDKTGNQFGTVILLHGNEHHPDWPGVIHTLRTQLPEVGWSTLSIAVPNYEYQPPPAPGAAPIAPPTTPDTYISAVALIPILTQRITQSLPLITEPNKPIVILAEGVSANWLLAINSTLADPRFRGVILVTAQTAQDSPPIDFAQLLQQQPNRFLLDITSTQDFNFAQAQARDVTARRARSDRYQLITVTGSVENFNSPLFLKQVRGWLRKRLEGK